MIRKILLLLAVISTNVAAQAQSQHQVQVQDQGLVRLQALPPEQLPIQSQSEPQAQSENRKPLQGQASYEGPIETPVSLKAATAASAPAKVYRGWLEETHPQFSLSTSAMTDNRLVVITDKYDEAERTLKLLQIPFTAVSKRDFESHDISGAQLVIIDCGPQDLSINSKVKIRNFVLHGGYLLTTDWMLDRLDQQAFPGYISWNGANNPSRIKIYDASLVGKDPVLFRHAVTNASWKMDIHCHMIRVLNKEAVKVLARSTLLAHDDPDSQGILAVDFPFGKGYVMHMMAHFDRSQGNGAQIQDPAPAIGISLRQALAINFVVAALEGTKL